MKSAETNRTTVLVTSCLLFLIIAATSIYGAGGLDATFKGAVYSTGSTIWGTAVQDDGKIILVGDFTVVNNAPRNGIARLNADGSLDSSFLVPEMSGTVQAVTLQPDGKILIGGGFSIVGSSRKYFVRLNPNGSLDTGFADIGGLFGYSPSIYKIFVRPDGKILFSGRFISFGGRGSRINRLNADGSFDPSFFFGSGGEVWDSTLLPDDKIVASTYSAQRYLSEGGVDPTFPVLSGSEQVTSTEALPDGKVILGGDFTTIGATPVGRLTKVLSDGNVDPTFNPGGSGANGRIFDVAPASDGKIYITGSFTQYNGVARARIARLNADGTLDTSFSYTQPTTSSSVSRAFPTADGGIIITGTNAGGRGVSLVKLNADGSINPAVKAIVGTPGTVRDIVRQPDGKYIIAGKFNIIDGVIRPHVARLNADGTLDPSFDCSTFYNITPLVTRLALQPDGKVIVTLLDFPGSIRFNTDGSYDFSYVPPPFITGNDVDLFGNGKVLINGYYKLNADGSLDTTFNPPNLAATVGLILSAAIQPDGKIIIGGSFAQIGSTPRGRVARLTTDGSLDATFNPSGGANGKVSDLDLQADGKIVIAGDFTSVNGDTSKKYVARLNADGSLDASFSPIVNAGLTTVKVQPDGKILIGGTMTTVNGVARKGYSRLHADGSLDLSFNVNAPANGMVWRVGVQADNKVLIAGDFGSIGSTSAIGVARLNPSTKKTGFDYDGDGRSDVSVFRPSENKWYVLQSSNGGVAEKTFAVAGDLPVPGDYDGDGITDVAIFRPSNGAWWYLSSINSAQITTTWGQAGDIPRPSDFDGDGKTDFVVYRPSNGVWYRFGSTGATSIQAFGASGDLPLVGDFDGDGKSDNAIFRPSTGDWWYASSVTGQFIAVHWGASGDIPVAGDYDGDGQTDFVVFRPSDGGWYILYSTGTYTIATFGTVGDKPIAADYDGDGKTDVGVWRPSTGTWYLLQTTAGFGALQWGVANDIATPNAFVP